MMKIFGAALALFAVISVAQARDAQIAATPENCIYQMIERPGDQVRFLNGATCTNEIKDRVQRAEYERVTQSPIALR